VLITLGRFLNDANDISHAQHISPEARLPDGRSHLDRSADTVIALIRDRLSATAETDGPLP
jgi:hypothetical protein